MEKIEEVCIDIFKERKYSSIEKLEDRISAIKQNGDTICCFLNVMTKLNTELTQQYINIMNELELKHIIIIYKNLVTSSAKKLIEKLPYDKTNDISIRIELFAEHELKYNILKHILQPKFEILSNEESKELKKKYGNKFPIMLHTDPVARFYDCESGRFIKIICKKTGIVSYRIVK
jgi:DNA-directed RNA polymerase subunit H (RpoH/RPB5)